MQTERSFTRSFFLTVSFIEGGAVMAVELLGAKMLAPYFGTSMPVWAAALGLTLGGLMLGYFAGGKMSVSFGKNPKGLFTILIISGILISFMTIAGDFIMNLTYDWELRTGSSLSLLIFMFPPLFLLGTVSPIIIELITDTSEEAGNISGTVYAISTLGGILTTFLLGFWILPEYGILIPSVTTGIIVSILPLAGLIHLHSTGRKWIILLIVPLFFTPLGMANEHPHMYYQEGIMGQVIVDDFVENGHNYRGLFVNGTLQTVKSLDDEKSQYWAYTRMIGEFISTMPKGEKSLLLGMAGGTLISPLQENGFQVDAVEIDQRMDHIAQEFFNNPAPDNFIIDDARHYLNTCSTLYDLIIFDTFHGESVPEHLITKESLEKLANILKGDGLCIINFYGFRKGPESKIGHILFQTLINSGWKVLVFSTPGNEGAGNLEYVISKSEEILDEWERVYVQRYPHRASSDYTFEFNEASTLPDHMLLTDELTQSIHYNKAAEAWRELYRQNEERFHQIIR